MVRPCPHRIDCEGSDFPITNYSAEASEQDPVFVSLVFPNDPFSSRGCLSTCTSTVSQLEADLCAQAQEAQCTEDNITEDGGGGSGPGGPGGDPFVKTTPYLNDPQYCTQNCPDGLSYTVTVPAGLFVESTQAAANAQALAYACELARKHIICMSALIPEGFCKDTSATCKIFVTGKTTSPPHTWELISGVIPSGLIVEGLNRYGSWVAFTTTGVSYVDYIRISGTPTSAGPYTFTFKATDGNGSYIQKVFTVCVIEISPTTASLPTANYGASYSQTLTATSCATTPLSWQIVDGSLPAGLALDEETGKITGTPTEFGTFTFTVSVQTEAS